MPVTGCDVKLDESQKLELAKEIKKDGGLTDVYERTKDAIFRQYMDSGDYGSGKGQGRDDAKKHAKEMASMIMKSVTGQLGIKRKASTQQGGGTKKRGKRSKAPATDHDADSDDGDE